MILTFVARHLYSRYGYFCRVKKYSGYISYFLFWLLFFIVTKALFLAYNHSLTSSLSAAEIVNVFFYGLRMDVSFTSYLCIFPFILFLVRSVAVEIDIRKVLRIYTICLIILLSFLATADCELYRAWGFRMDITPASIF